MSVALVKIQIRNDTAQAWAVANPFLSDGEPGAESNTGRLKIGNGIDRWLDLPYVGGDGSGGGGTNPITGNIDGGVYTGNPRTAECGPPVQPAASMAVVEGEGQLVVSWGPASLDNPDLDTILYYVVETTTTPTDDSTYRQVGQSNTFGDPVNFAAVSEPLPTDPQNEYTYRVKAVLESGGLGEWAYTSYRHFPVPQPVEFDLVASSDTLGSTGEDNVVTISIANLTGGLDLRGPTWSYPAVTGIEGVENSEYLQLTNTAGVDTVDQAMFVSCVFYDGPQDAEFAVTRTIQINIKNTSDDPGPGPGPNPTPGDVLPLFNWDLVEDATDPPPGLVTKSEGLSPSTGRWPPTYQPATTPQYQRPCQSQEQCNYRYPCGDFTGCKICDVYYATEWEFTDFSIIWSSPNRQQAGINVVPTPVTQCKKLKIAGGASCTYESMILNVNPEDGNPELQLPNPLINIIDEFWEDPTQQTNRRYTEYLSAWQKLDRIDLNGTVASYAVLYPESHSKSQENTSYPMSCTGAMIVTRDEGSTFQFVDVRGIGFTWTHYGGPDVPGNPNGMPKMLTKCKSITNGRDVLVGLFEFEGGQDPVQQFYYTDDHVRWYPCDNRDRLTETTKKIWYDAFTDTVYATDDTHTGENVNGVYSYYKSGAGVVPRPPEEPTFNWSLVLDSPTSAPGQSTYFERYLHGRPPFYSGTAQMSGHWVGAIGQPPFGNLQEAYEYKLNEGEAVVGQPFDMQYWGPMPKGVYLEGDVAPGGQFQTNNSQTNNNPSPYDAAYSAECYYSDSPPDSDGPPPSTPPTIRPDGGTGPCPPNVCGVEVPAVIKFENFTLLFSFKNGLGTWPETSTYPEWYGCEQGDSVSGDPTIVKITRDQPLTGTLDERCSATPVQVLVPSGQLGEFEIVDLAVQNPFVSECLQANYDFSWDDINSDAERPINSETGLPDYFCWQKVGGYQILDQVECGGTTASYLLLNPRKVSWTALDGTTYEEQITGMCIVTIDDGATWRFVDVFQKDQEGPQNTTTVNPIDAGEDWDQFAKSVQLPKMLSRVWSHYLNRYVVVALMQKVANYTSGGAVEQVSTHQFYYTDDHVNWYACSQEDGELWGLGPDNTPVEQPSKMWTDLETGNTYLTNSTNTGIVTEEGGTCSYWQSVRG